MRGSFLPPPSANQPVKKIPTHMVGENMPPSKKYPPRPDKAGTHRRQFETNRKRILSTQNICGICGKPVDKKLKYPDPMSPTVDHIIPIARGGHPSDIDNLQLAHMSCNRWKSDKLIQAGETSAEHLREGDKEIRIETISNRILPLTVDWTNYKSQSSVKENREEPKEMIVNK